MPKHPKQPNLNFKTLTFANIIQEHGEQFDDFLMRLQSQVDRLLMDNIIAGIRNDLVREELLSDADITLDRTIQVCRESELALNTATTSKEVAKRKRATKGTLLTINDECLRQIVQFLNIFDAVNLAATCPRMHIFANSVIFPMKAKQMNIVCDRRITFNINKSTGLPLKDINTTLSYCGEFVEEMVLDNWENLWSDIDDVIWRSFAIVIKNCQNLVKLSLSFIRLTRKEIHQMQNIIENLQYLKELEFAQFFGVTDTWRAVKGISKVVKFTLSTVEDRVSDNFLNYFKNLSSLNIRFYVERDNKWRPEYLAQIFDNNGHSLRHLKLADLYSLEGYESVGTLIAAKLPKLESLELEFEIKEETKYMIELPHLKFLKIYGREWVGSMNSYLRMHSEIGIIEELIVFAGVFDDAGANEPPLNFNKIRRIGWDCEKWPGFLQLMTRSQLLEIQNICCRSVKTDDLEDFLKFVTLNKTLKLIQLLNVFDHKLIMPWNQLIGILKEPSKPRRPFLNLVLWRLSLGEEDVS